MKQILVTTDLSPESFAAFPEAVNLAKVFDANVTLLAVIEDPAQAAMTFALDFPVLPDQEVQDQLRARVQSDLEEIVNEHFEETRSTPLVKDCTSTIYEEIIATANSIAADLLVMATHGRSTLTRVLIGSTAERVLRHSQRPVLIVPASEK